MMTCQNRYALTLDSKYILKTYVIFFSLIADGLHYGFVSRGYFVNVIKFNIRKSLKSSANFVPC